MNGGALCWLRDAIVSEDVDIYRCYGEVAECRLKRTIRQQQKRITFPATAYLLTSTTRPLLPRYKTTCTKTSIRDDSQNGGGNRHRTQIKLSAPLHERNRQYPDQTHPPTHPPVKDILAHGHAGIQVVPRRMRGQLVDTKTTRTAGQQKLHEPRGEKSPGMSVGAYQQ